MFESLRENMAVHVLVHVFEPRTRSSDEGHCKAETAGGNKEFFHTPAGNSAIGCGPRAERLKKLLIHGVAFWHCGGDRRRAGRQAEAIENLADGFGRMNGAKYSHASPTPGHSKTSAEKTRRINSAHAYLRGRHPPFLRALPESAAASRFLAAQPG